METKEVVVYKYEELDKKAKEKVLQDFRETMDMPFLSEELAEHLEEELKKNKIRPEGKIEIGYSLSYCQGDGLSFTGVVGWRGYQITIKRGGCRYMHEKSTDLYIETRYGHEAKGAVYVAFKELYFSICRTVRDIGYSEIAYQESEEAIKETIETNDYRFFKSGELFHQ